MSITVDGKMKDRCAEMVRNLREPKSDGGLIEASAWYKLVDDLHAFVLSEIGRAANEKLADSSALVLFFASPEGAEEVAKAIQEAMPGLVERKWP
jgi:hypothetical protein